jgi:hypothetical protein
MRARTRRGRSAIQCLVLNWGLEAARMGADPSGMMYHTVTRRPFDTLIGLCMKQ